MDDSFINDTARELASGLVVILKTGLDMLNSLLKAIPFSTQIMDYCRRSYQHDPLRILLEIMLVVFMVWYSFKNKPRETEQLTESEIQELIAQWEPEPLVPALTPDQKADLDKVLVTVGQPGLKLKTSDGRERLNFASFNYLGIMNAESIKEKSIVALRKYGVGSCGPPGFYGTIDVHLELESSLATFIGHQDAIIYAQGFACTSSAIPAFSKRGDVIVA